MEEEDASLFGSIVLSCFRPRILIVSTPNYEYNVILQKSSLTSQEGDPDDKTESQPLKFRNHDHKFEWTREQFNRWASELAARHNYSVEFSGVGGSAGTEPGFASQIAVFRSRSETKEDNPQIDKEVTHHHRVIWEWDSSNCSRTALWGVNQANSRSSSTYKSDLLVNLPGHIILTGMLCSFLDANIASVTLPKLSSYLVAYDIDGMSI